MENKKPSTINLNSAPLICERCGVSFQPYRLNQKYCSPTCRVGVYRDSHPRESAICTICGKTYFKHKSTQVLCGSPSCKRQWAKEYSIKKAQQFMQLREFYIFERDNFTCAYCGKTSYADSIKLHVDHVIPKAMGGKSIIGNLITSCALCNVTKQAMELACVNEILAVIRQRNLAKGIPNDTTFYLPGEVKDNDSLLEAKNLPFLAIDSSTR